MNIMNMIGPLLGGLFGGGGGQGNPLDGILKMAMGMLAGGGGAEDKGAEGLAGGGGNPFGGDILNLAAQGLPSLLKLM